MHIALNYCSSSSVPVCLSHVYICSCLSLTVSLTDKCVYCGISSNIALQWKRHTYCPKLLFLCLICLYLFTSVSVSDFLSLSLSQSLTAACVRAVVNPGAWHRRRGEAVHRAEQLLSPLSLSISLLFISVCVSLCLSVSQSVSNWCICVCCGVFRCILWHHSEGGAAYQPELLFLIPLYASLSVCIFICICMQGTVEGRCRGG